MHRLSALLLLLCLIGAACSSTNDSDPVSADGDATEQSSADGADGTDSDGQDGSEGPDDDDAADILGNPDLDTDDLPADVAEALDDIDDVVSIGACESETVGLAITAPDGWQCRVLDQPAGGLDGFTLFTEGNQLNITIGTPSPFGPPCEVLNLCDQATPVVLSANFPDTTSMEIAGTVTIWGSHASAKAELVITKPSALTDDEISLISQVLDSAVAI